MKKVFNLSVILAVLASALTFTSCSDDDDDAPEVLINVQTVASTAVINITCDEDLTSVALWKGGSKLKDLNLKDGVEKGENKTVFTLVDLEDGDYKVRVACEGNGEAEEKFTIGEGGAATYNFSAKSIAVEAGKEYVYSKKAGEGAAEGSFKVTAAEKGSVTLEIGGKTVTLSDAGASWLSNDFEAWKNADVTSGADVLLCLLKESTNIAGATESSNEVISGQASATYFAAK